MAFQVSIIEKIGLLTELTEIKNEIGNIISQNKNTGLIFFPQDYLFVDFQSDIQNNKREINLMTNNLIDIFSQLAKRFSLYLSPGSLLEVKEDFVYRNALLFDPNGKMILQQNQLFFADAEKKQGFKGEKQLNLTQTEFGQIGFLNGSDCFYPEVGRFLALEGVDLVLAPGNLSGNNYWRQLAGVWSQVQQNQFYALEAQINGLDLIHGPCEITPFRTGIIAPLGEKENALSGNPDNYLKSLAFSVDKGSDYNICRGFLNLDQLQKIRKDYPLKNHLNPQLYQKSGLEKLSYMGRGK